jgi:hypothetical protein
VHDPLLAPRSASGRDLDHELVDAAVLAEDGQPTEEDAVAAVDVVSVREVRDADEVVVVVLVLQVLAGYLDLVELLVLELDEPVRRRFEVDTLRLAVERLLVAVAPLLQALDVFAEVRLRREEVFLELGLSRRKRDVSIA